MLSRKETYNFFTSFLKPRWQRAVWAAIPHLYGKSYRRTGPTFLPSLLPPFPTSTPDHLEIRSVWAFPPLDMDVEEKVGKVTTQPKMAVEPPS